MKTKSLVPLCVAIIIMLVTNCAFAQKASKLPKGDELATKQAEYQKATSAKFTTDTLLYSIQPTITIYVSTIAYIKHDVFFRPTWTGKQMQQVLHDSVVYAMKIQLLQFMYLWRNAILDENPYTLTTSAIAGYETQSTAFQTACKLLQTKYLDGRLSLSGDKLKDLQNNLIKEQAEIVCKTFETDAKKLFADEIAVQKKSGWFN